MNIFEYDVHKRLKLMKNVIENVALDEFKLADDNIFYFNFLNTFSGRPFRKLLCHNVWKVIFETGMAEDDEFPCFITDVKVLRLESNQIANAFNFFKYAYEIPDSLEYNLVSIYGGDIDIDLICGKIEIIETDK